jgi:hypothetical protein
MSSSSISLDASIHKENPMRTRLTLATILTALLAMAVATPTAAKDFGTIYVDGTPYRTFGTPARVDPGTGTDPIVSFSNFDQGGVALHAPGRGSHGGRWEVWVATWDDPADARLVTSFGEVMDLVEAGDLTLVRNPGADFRCPILPNTRP